jgi:adenine C2-methylase RlmN of 23S rRNA A2503 and tRNA A37
MDLNALDRALAERGEPSFRAAQVWGWVARGAPSYADMTNLPLGLRCACAASRWPPTGR